MYIKVIKTVFIFSFLLLNLNYKTAFSSEFDSDEDSNEYDYFLFGRADSKGDDPVHKLIDGDLCVYKCTLERSFHSALCKAYHIDESETYVDKTTLGLLRIPGEFDIATYQHIHTGLTRTFKWDTIKALLNLKSQEDKNGSFCKTQRPFEYKFTTEFGTEATMNYFLYLPNLNKYSFYPYKSMLFISNEKEINDTESICSVRSYSYRFDDKENLCIKTKKDGFYYLDVLARSNFHAVPNNHEITSSEFSSFRKNILNNLEVLNLNENDCISISDKKYTCCVLSSGTCYDRTAENLDPIAENPKRLFTGSVNILDKNDKFHLVVGYGYDDIEAPFPFDKKISVAGPVKAR